jgi:hypothetical protein
MSEPVQTNGIVIHSPVDGTIHYGIDGERRLHVWWNGPPPAGVKEVETGVQYSVEWPTPDRGGAT